MKKKVKILSLLLVFVMMFSLASCGEENGTATNTETGEKILSNEERAIEDTKYLEQFIKDYRQGKYDGEKVFQYEDLSVYFKLGDYSELYYPDDPYISTEVTDQAVEDCIVQLVLENKVTDDQYTELTEGTAQKFDVAVIDYEGYIDGKKKDRACDTDANLILGSGTFMDGFEEGIIGKKIGGKITLKLSFSPYYEDSEVAGKDVEFKVTLKKVLRPTLPEITPEIFEALTGEDFDDMDGVRAYVRKYLESRAQSNSYSNLSTYLQREVLKKSEMLSYPEKELEHYRSQFISYYTQNAKDGITLEEFCKDELGISYEEFNSYALEYAREAMKATLMVKLIAQKENITCTDEQLKSIIVQMYQENMSYYGSLESFLVDYSDIYSVDYFEDEVISAAVSEFLTEKAVKVGDL